MASVVYNTFKQKIMTGEVDLDTDTIKCALLDNTYTSDIDTHAAWSDVSAKEVSGTGYTTLGATLSGVTVMRDLTNDKGVFDANDVTWANSTITARYAVLYKSVAGSSTTSWLICCFDFTTDKSSSNGDFTIQWNASGILNLS